MTPPPLPEGVALTLIVRKNRLVQPRPGTTLEDVRQAFQLSRNVAHLPVLKRPETGDCGMRLHQNLA